jgi:DNA-directed RNA polymerase sigma subunit (sigma70/sigma32)
MIYPEDFELAALARREVEVRFSEMTEREVESLRLRMRGDTQQDAAKAMGISSERAYQLQASAIRRLRKSMIRDGVAQDIRVFCERTRWGMWGSWI